MPDYYPYHYMQDAADPDVVHIYDTGGSYDPSDWTHVGDGNLKDGQSFDDFIADTRAGEGVAELDDLRPVSDTGEEGASGSGDEEEPPPDLSDEMEGEDEDGADPADGPEDEEGDDDDSSDGRDDDDGGDGEGVDDGGDEEGNGDDEDGDGDDEDGDDDGLGEESSDEGGDTGDLEDRLNELYAALAALEDAMAEAEGAMAGIEGELDGLEREADRAAADAEKLGRAANAVDGTVGDLAGLLDDLDSDLAGLGALDPLATPNLSDLVVDPVVNPASGAEPVLLYSGAFVHSAVDLQVPSSGLDVVVARRYHSQAYLDGPLGPKWRLAFHDTLRQLASGKVVRITDDFTQVVYAPDGAGFVSPPGWTDVLERDGAGWRIHDGFGVERRYNGAGLPTEIADRYGNKLRFNWTAGLLTEVRDPGSRVYRLAYDANRRLASLTAPDNSVTSFAFDATGRLTTVTPPRPAVGELPATVRYRYVDGTDPRALHNLDEIREVGGASPFTIAYGTSGSSFNRVTRQRYQGVDIAIQYLDGAGEIERRTMITDRVGVTSVHHFDAEGRRRRVEVLSDGRSPNAPGVWATAWTYSDAGLIERVIRPGGDVIEYVYDENNPDPLSRHNLLSATHRPRSGAPDADSLIETYRYGPFNQVTRITGPDGRATDLTVDAGGRTVAVAAPAVPRPGGGQARPTLAYTFDPSGQVATRTDPNGLVTRYLRYASGPRKALVRRVEEDDGAGTVRATDYVLDDLGRCVEVRPPIGGVTRMHYDGRGRLTSVERDGVEVRRFGYTRHDRLVRSSDRHLEPDGTPSQPEWVDTVFTLDGDGQVRSSSIEANGTTLQRLDYTRDGEGRVVRVSGPGGATQEWTFDERGLLLSATEAPGTSDARTQSFRHGLNGEVVEMVDPLGALWRYEVDDFGRTVAAIDPLGHRDEIDHDSLGRPVAMRRRAPNGALRSSVELRRDALGRVTARRVAELDALGNATSWLSETTVYDLEGNSVRLTSAAGGASEATYDRFGQVLAQVDPLGNQIAYERDVAGQITAVTRTERLAGGGAVAVRNEMTRDARGVVISTVDSLGRSESFEYDGQGRPRAWVRADGVEVATSYDALGRATSSTITDPSTGDTWSEAFVWDPRGQLASVEDAAGHLTSFDYDRLGRLARVVDANGVIRQRNTWDAGDRLTRWQDARGVRVDQRFDPLGRVVERTVTAPASVAGARHETYVYDALGNPIATDADGLVTKAVFDSRNLRVGETQHGETVTRGFDAAGRPTSLRYPSGVVAGYDYDALGRVHRLRLTQGTGSSWPGATPPAQVADYTWSGRELRASIATAGVRASWDHDALGRPFRLRTRRGGAVLADELVVRDALGRVIAVDDVVAGRTLRLDHDARDLLIGIEPVSAFANRNALVTLARGGGPSCQSDLEARVAALAGAGGPDWSFEHDDAGNRVHDETPDGVHDFTVDDADRVIGLDGVAIVNDDAGLLLDDGVCEYAYDYAGRLCRITDGAGLVVWEVQRDALGRIAVVAEGGASRRLFHDGSRVIESRPVGTATADRAWLWGALPGELALFAAGGSNHVALPNWHGDVGLLVSATGQAVERYRYGAFGDRTVLGPGGAVLAASAFGNDLGYLTRPHLPGGTLVLAGARALHTGWGRFTSPDPAGYLDGANLYQYAAGDPYSRADRTGHSATFVGGALGLAAGVGWAAGSMINAGIYEATDGNWGEKWQGVGHYGSQVVQFTASGAMMGAAVDLAPVGGGVVSAGLMGAGISGLISAPSGDWGEWGGDVAVGGAVGVGFWGAGKLLAPIATPVAGAIAATALGRVVTAGLNRLGSTGVASAVGGALSSVRTSLAVAAENTWGNSVMSRLAGPAMRAHANAALARQGLSAADLAAFDQIHAQTMASLATQATTWGGFQRAYWIAARQTPAFQAMFPAGAGAPVYGTFGQLNIHHLHGRIEGLLFQESNLMLVPNAFDTPFLHSAAYLTGTQQHLIRRGLRALFPRQWLNGGLGAAVSQLVPDIGDVDAGKAGCAL